MISDSSTKQKLANEMEKEFQRELESDNLPQDEITKRINRSHKKITEAPVIIMLCMDISEMDSYSDKHRKKAEFIIATQSTANAGMQLLLAAHAEGLGGVWVCSPIFAQKTVQTALDLPKAWEPQAMFLIGYPAEIPPARERKNIKEITKWVQTSLDV